MTVGLVAICLVACGAATPRGDCDPHPAPGTVGTVCGFANPEDVEAVAAARLLLVSEMRPLSGAGQGALAAVTFESLATPRPSVRRLWPPPDGVVSAPSTGDPSCTAPPDPAAFSPHGISTRAQPDGSVTVAVVSHAPREAIELFALRGQGDAATLTWTGCVPLPPSTAGNDLAIAPDGALVVADCMPSFGGASGALSMLSAAVGLPTGDVMLWSANGGWRHLPNSGARMANGIAVAADGSAAFFTETGAHRIGRIDGLAPGGAPAVTRAALDGSPDNLTWTSRGTLLTASHVASAGFVTCVLGRPPCRSAWELLEIDPRTLESTVLLRHDGDAIGAVSSVAEVDGRYYLGAVFDDRIGVWSPAR